MVSRGLPAAGAEAPAPDPAPQEVAPAGEAEAIASIVAMIEAGANALAERGQQPVLRDAHAKGHGCVRAAFAIDADLPPDLRKGIFAEARSYPAWIRFSNGSLMPKEDRIGDVRGMAIKLVGVPGPKLLADESDAATQDFVLVDFPRFFLRDALEYVPFTTLALQGRRDAHFEGKPDQKAILDAMEGRSVAHLFAHRYFSMTPSLLGERPVKLSAWPVACEVDAAPRTDAAGLRAAPEARTAESNPNDLRAGMRAWLEARDACFRFTVQPQADATMPVEDPTVLWDEARSPPIEVATIRIPRQRSDEAARQAFCENLSFTPWHSLPEHRPIGGINRVRKAVYLAVSTLRHRLNQAPRVEPTAVEAVP